MQNTGFGSIPEVEGPEKEKKEEQQTGFGWGMLQPDQFECKKCYTKNKKSLSVRL